MADLETIGFKPGLLTGCASTTTVTRAAQVLINRHEPWSPSLTASNQMICHETPWCLSKHSMNHSIVGCQVAECLLGWSGRIIVVHQPCCRSQPHQPHQPHPAPAPAVLMDSAGKTKPGKKIIRRKQRGNRSSSKLKLPVSARDCIWSRWWSHAWIPMTPCGGNPYDSWWNHAASPTPPLYNYCLNLRCHKITPDRETICASGYGEQGLEKTDHRCRYRFEVDTFWKRSSRHRYPLLGLFLLLSVWLYQVPSDVQIQLLYFSAIANSCHMVIHGASQILTWLQELA